MAEPLIKVDIIVAADIHLNRYQTEEDFDVAVIVGDARLGQNVAGLLQAVQGGV